MLILVVFDVKQVRFQTGSVIRFAESKFFKGSGERGAHAACGDWANLGRRGAPSLRCFGGGVRNLCFVELADEARLDRNK